MAKILVVDDEPSIRVLIRAALEDAGHEVIEAADGPDGLALARSGGADVILLDVVLPNLSGTEVCRLLRADPSWAPAPILLLTGVEPTTPQLDVAGRIYKPFRPQELLAQVDKALQLPMAS